jgi:hypothetical protein
VNKKENTRCDQQDQDNQFENVFSVHQASDFLRMGNPYHKTPVQ